MQKKILIISDSSIIAFLEKVTKKYFKLIIAKATCGLDVKAVKAQLLER